MLRKFSVRGLALVLIALYGAGFLASVSHAQVTDFQGETAEQSTKSSNDTVTPGKASPSAGSPSSDSPKAAPSASISSSGCTKSAIQEAEARDDNAFLEKCAKTQGSVKDESGTIICIKGADCEAKKRALENFVSRGGNASYYAPGANQGTPYQQLDPLTRSSLTRNPATTGIDDAFGGGQAPGAGGRAVQTQTVNPSAQASDALNQAARIPAGEEISGGAGVQTRTVKTVDINPGDVSRLNPQTPIESLRSKVNIPAGEDFLAGTLRQQLQYDPSRIGAGARDLVWNQGATIPSSVPVRAVPTYNFTPSAAVPTAFSFEPLTGSFGSVMAGSQTFYQSLAGVSAPPVFTPASLSTGYGFVQSSQMVSSPVPTYSSVPNGFFVSPPSTRGEVILGSVDGQIIPMQWDSQTGQYVPVDTSLLGEGAQAAAPVPLGTQPPQIFSFTQVPTSDELTQLINTPFSEAVQNANGRFFQPTVVADGISTVDLDDAARASIGAPSFDDVVTKFSQGDLRGAARDVGQSGYRWFMCSIGACNQLPDGSPARISLPDAPATPSGEVVRLDLPDVGKVGVWVPTPGGQSLVQFDPETIGSIADGQPVKLGEVMSSACGDIVCSLRDFETYAQENNLDTASFTFDSENTKEAIVLPSGSLYDSGERFSSTEPVTLAEVIEKAKENPEQFDPRTNGVTEGGGRVGYVYDYGPAKEVESNIAAESPAPQEEKDGLGTRLWYAASNCLHRACTVAETDYIMGRQPPQQATEVEVVTAAEFEQRFPRQNEEQGAQQVAITGEKAPEASQLPPLEERTVSEIALPGEPYTPPPPPESTEEKDGRVAQGAPSAWERVKSVGKGIAEALIPSAAAEPALHAPQPVPVARVAPQEPGAVQKVSGAAVPAASANPLAGLPLSYCIGGGQCSASQGRVAVRPYNATAPIAPTDVAYVNLLSEAGKVPAYAPYLPDTSTSAQYREGRPDPAGPGFEKNIREQFARRAQQGFKYVELDNKDAYGVPTSLRAMDVAAQYGLGVVVKNPGIVQGGNSVDLLRHQNAVGVIVEKGAGEPAAMDALRKAAGRPDMPVWFVGFGSDVSAGQVRASEIERGNFTNMGVTHSDVGEYRSVRDVRTPIAKADALPTTPVQSALAALAEAARAKGQVFGTKNKNGQVELLAPGEAAKRSQEGRELIVYEKGPQLLTPTQVAKDPALGDSFVRDGVRYVPRGTVKEYAESLQKEAQKVMRATAYGEVLNANPAFANARAGGVLQVSPDGVVTRSGSGERVGNIHDVTKEQARILLAAQRLGIAVSPGNDGSVRDTSGRALVLKAEKGAPASPPGRTVSGAAGVSRWVQNTAVQPRTPSTDEWVQKLRDAGVRVVDVRQNYKWDARKTQSVQGMFFHGDVAGSQALLGYCRKTTKCYANIIAEDGTVYMTAGVEDQPSHASGANGFTQSAVIAGADNGRDATPAAMQAALKMAGVAMDSFGWKVTSHGQSASYSIGGRHAYEGGRNFVEALFAGAVPQGGATVEYGVYAVKNDGAEERLGNTTVAERDIASAREGVVFVPQGGSPVPLGEVQVGEASVQPKATPTGIEFEYAYTPPAPPAPEKIPASGPSARIGAIDRARESLDRLLGLDEAQPVPTAPQAPQQSAPASAPQAPSAGSSASVQAFSCVPGVLLEKGSTTLSWECGAGSHGSTGTGFSTNGLRIGSATVVPVASTTFELTCTAPSGNVRRSCLVEILRPEVALVANPSKVTHSAATHISWATKDTTACVLYGDSTNALYTGTTTDAVRVPRVEASTRFELVCTTRAGVPMRRHVLVEVEGYTGDVRESSAPASAGEDTTLQQESSPSSVPPTEAGLNAVDSQGNPVQLCDPAMGAYRFIECLMK